MQQKPSDNLLLSRHLFLYFRCLSTRKNKSFVFSVYEHEGALASISPARAVAPILMKQKGE